MRRLMLLTVLALAAPLAAQAPQAAAANALWQGVVSQHVRDGRVNYEAIRHDARFAQLMTALAQVDAAPLSRLEKLALYLNAYNAFVIKGLLDQPQLPQQVTEVRGFFDALNYTLAGRSVTLDNLTNQLIRPLGDPRVHAALTGGGVSGPWLRNEAYLPDKLNAQLDDQAKRYVNTAALNRVDRANKKLLLAMPFKWFADDFEAAGGPAGFVQKYLTDAEAKQWLATSPFTIEYLKPDWTVNKQ